MRNYLNQLLVLLIFFIFIAFVFYNREVSLFNRVKTGRQFIDDAIDSSIFHQKEKKYFGNEGLLLSKKKELISTENRLTHSNSKKQYLLSGDREYELTPNFAYEQDFLRTMNPELKRPTPELLPSIVNKNISIFKNQQLTQRLPGNNVNDGWRERGPSNIGGRTRAVAWDPNDSAGKKVWAGGVTGGLWYNNDITNVESSWISVNDFWNSLSITKIAFDPINPKTIYIATGEGYFVGAGIGAGIWKSTDGGAQWTQLPSTVNFNYINDIIIRNENGVSVIYAAVDGGNHKGTWFSTEQAGLRRSSDGGVNWSQVMPPISGNPLYNFIVSSIAIGKNNRLWVGTKASPFGLPDRGGGRVLFSDDGINWTESDMIAVTNGHGRTTVAVAPNSTTCVYSFIEDQNKLKSLRKTNDGGLTWRNLASIPDDADNGIPLDDFTRGQAWYDQALAVSPLDSNVVLIGGINLFRSSDGGDTWQQISKWSNNPSMNTLSVPYVHADQHAIAFKPNDSLNVLFGTDGGIFHTSNIKSNIISARNKNYNVTQFYAGAIHPGLGINYYLAGSQDNGTQKFSAPEVNQTSEVTGGDGAYCFIDQLNPEIQITSYVYNNYYLSTNGGNSFSALLSENTGSFINPAAYDSYQHVLYTNASGANASALELNIIKNINANPIRESLRITGLQTTITAMAVSPHNQQSTTLFLGTSSGMILKLENANRSPKLSLVSNNLPNGSVSCIEFGKTEDELLVTFFNYGINKIWFSSNGGANWNNKMGDFPNIPVRWALMHPFIGQKEVLLATELGVFGTNNFDAVTPNWFPVNAGFANVRTEQLLMRKSDFQVIAVTHGRGLFSSNVFSEGSPPVIISFSPKIINSDSIVTIKGKNLTATKQVRFGGVLASTFNVINDSVLIATAGKGASGLVSVTNNGGEYVSGGITYCEKPLIIAPVVSACEPDSVILTVGTGQSYQWFKDGQIMIGDTLQTLKASKTGLYFVKVSQSNGCLQNSDTISISISKSPPKPSISKDSSGVLLSSSSTGNQWYLNGALISGATGNTYIPKVSGSYSVKVTLQSCTSLSSDPLNYLLCPQPTIASPGLQICIGDTMLLSTGIGASFQWFRNGSLLSGETKNVLRITDSGSYSVQLTDSVGCVSTSAVKRITGQLKPSRPSLVRDSLGGLFSSSAIGNVWFRNDSLLLGETGQLIRPKISGVYRVRVELNGCSSSLSDTVNFKYCAPPVLTYAANTFCEGDSLQLDAGVGVKFQWYRNNGALASFGSDKKMVFVKDSGNYTVQVTRTDGCISTSESVSIKVTVRPAKPSISRDANGNLLSSSSTGNQWYLNGALISGATGNTYIPKVSGSYSVKVTLQSCTSLSSDPLNYLLCPQPTIASPGLQICIGDTMLLSTGIGASFQWFRNGSLLSGETKNVLRITDSGSYSVQLTDSVGCVSTSAVKRITGQLKPSRPSLVRDSLGGLFSSSAIGNVWFRNDSLLLGETGQLIRPKISGVYRVRVELNGCSSSLSDTVNFKYCAPPVLTYAANTFCEGDSLQLDAGVGVKFQWYRNNGALASFGSDKKMVFVKDSGNYTVQVTRTDGCISTSESVSIKVTVRPAKPSISRDANGNLISSSSTGNQWFFENTKVDGANKNSYKPIQNGNVYVQLSLNGCLGLLSEPYYYLLTTFQQYAADKYIKTYPNPTVSSLTVDFKWPGILVFGIQIYDMQGRKVMNYPTIISGNQLDIQKLAKGTYKIVFTDKRGKEIWHNLFVK